MSAPTWDETSAVDQTAGDVQPASATQQAPTADPGAPSWENTYDVQEKYGGVGGQLAAGVQGAAEGLLGPLAPALERVSGIPTQTIRDVKEANPISTGVGNAAGLLGGALTGTGEMAIAEGAGRLATEGLGLAKSGAEAVPYLTRVGSEAAKQAAEMAVLSGSDEVSKMILQDPDQTASSAIANVGLSAALGAGGGALFAGAVSPLWKATVGDRAGQFMDQLIGTINGKNRLEMPQAYADAYSKLGITPSPIMTAALSGDADALSQVQELYRSQHSDVIGHLAELPEQVRQSVAQGLGVDLKDALNFSANEAGEEVGRQFKSQLSREFEPLVAEQKKVAEQEATIHIPDEDALSLRNKILETGAMDRNVGTDSPSYKLYEEVARRVESKADVGGIEALRQELRRRASGAVDGETRFALNNLRGMLNDFKESYILKAGEQAGLDGMDHSLVDKAIEAHRQAVAAREAAVVGSGARRIRDDLAAEAQSAKDTARRAAAQAKDEGREAAQGLVDARRQASANYRQGVQRYENIMDHLGLGDWKGEGTLQKKLDSLTNEDIIKKFSTKGDVEQAKILQQNFPEIAEMVRQHEAKKFLSGAVYRQAGQPELDVKKLNTRLASLMKGSPEHANFILSPEAISRIQAADVIHDGISTITSIKDSGTPGGIWKLLKQLGPGAGAAIGTLGGHGGFSGGVMGGIVSHAANYFGKELPDAYKLGMLKLMASEQGTNSAGMKAMVNYLGKAYRGADMVSKATADVLKPSAQVLGEKLVVSATHREKMDKLVDEYQDDPTKFAQRVQGSDLGHYLPEHETAMSMQATGAVQYLAQLKPKPLKVGPLDKPQAPSAMAMSRYNRALDIGQQPLSVLQHVKDGTLQASDIQDMNAMYPGLHQGLIQKLSQHMANNHHGEEPIPYRTRMGLSLFMGQPVDSTMTPQSIMAAQSTMAPKQPPGAGPQGKKPGAKAATMMNDTANSYKTPGQSAESDRSSRS